MQLDVGIAKRYDESHLWNLVPHDSAPSGRCSVARGKIDDAGGGRGKWGGHQNGGCVR